MSAKIITMKDWKPVGNTKQKCKAEIQEETLLKREILQVLLKIEKHLCNLKIEEKECTEIEEWN